jgi:nitrogen fixation NifU-like protein
MDIYREEILDHYRNPRNFGELMKADVKHKETNASCGDMVEVALKWQKEKGDRRIGEIKFRGVGCAISLAAASMLTEAVKGKTAAEIEKMSEQDVMKLLGVEIGPARKKCAVLGLVALKQAIMLKSGR